MSISSRQWKMWTPVSRRHTGQCVRQWEIFLRYSTFPEKNHSAITVLSNSPLRNNWNTVIQWTKRVELLATEWEVKQVMHIPWPVDLSPIIQSRGSHSLHCYTRVKVEINLKSSIWLCNAEWEQRCLGSKSGWNQNGQHEIKLFSTVFKSKNSMIKSIDLVTLPPKFASLPRRVTGTFRSLALSLSYGRKDTILKWQYSQKWKLSSFTPNLTECICSDNSREGSLIECF